MLKLGPSAPCQVSLQLISGRHLVHSSGSLLYTSPRLEANLHKINMSQFVHLAC